MALIKSLFKKYKEIILYLIFGVLTTLVNYIVYFSSKIILQKLNVGEDINYKISTVIAWVVAVGFAYITNRIWVFDSSAKGGKQLTKELTLFVSARLFSLGLELLIMFIGMDLLDAGDFKLKLLAVMLPMGELITKTIAQIVIIVSNFVFSKLIIFKNKN